MIRQKLNDCFVKRNSLPKPQEVHEKNIFVAFLILMKLKIWCRIIIIVPLRFSGFQSGFDLTTFFDVDLIFQSSKQDQNKMIEPQLNEFETRLIEKDFNLPQQQQVWSWKFSNPIFPL